MSDERLPRELSLYRAPTERKEPPIAMRAEKPLAPDIESMLGMVQGGSPVPLDSRTTRVRLPFEEPKVRTVILDRLRKGLPVKVCMAAAGQGSRNWAVWRSKGLRGLEPYASFLHEVECAVAEGAVALVDDIRKAGIGAPDQHGIWKNNWQASKYLLEVNDPATFNVVQKSITAHVEVEPMKSSLDTKNMSDEDLAALVDVLDRAPVVDVEFEEVEG